jgi:DNA-binding response OmpR family regulator
MSCTILIIEDDPDIARLVQTHLHDINCQADIAVTGEQGLAVFADGQYALVVLDLMLPGIDGLAVCRSLREQGQYVPILMLTAKTTELDRVVGLETGADDYLSKPFGILELQARVKALLRRSRAFSEQVQAEQPPAGRLSLGALHIDIDQREVRVDDREVGLTAREFDLLLHFAQHPGRVFSRVQLLDQVWGYNHEGYEHTVNSHINRLRAKIEQNPAQPEYILTVWGVGYKMGRP